MAFGREIAVVSTAAWG
jgi:hypothetical protein